MTDFLTAERLLVAADKIMPVAAQTAERAANIFRSLAMEIRGLTLPGAKIEEAGASSQSATRAAKLAEEAYSPSFGLPGSRGAAMYQEAMEAGPSYRTARLELVEAGKIEPMNAEERWALKDVRQRSMLSGDANFRPMTNEEAATHTQAKIAAFTRPGDATVAGRLPWADEADAWTAMALGQNLESSVAATARAVRGAETQASRATAIAEDLTKSMKLPGSAGESGEITVIDAAKGRGPINSHTEIREARADEAKVNEPISGGRSKQSPVDEGGNGKSESNPVAERQPTRAERRAEKSSQRTAAKAERRAKRIGNTSGRADAESSGKAASGPADAESSEVQLALEDGA